MLFLLALPLFSQARPFAEPDTFPGYRLYADTFCSNQLVLVYNQLFGPDNPSGIVVIPGAAYGGADSVIEVRLSFFSTVRTLNDQTLCEGDTLLINNRPYHQNFFLGEEIIERGAANGCDSVIEIQLNFLTLPYSIVSDTLCADEFRTINGVRYDRGNPNGLERLPNAGANGCDSLILVTLHFRQIWVYAGPDRQVVLGDTVCLNPQVGFVPIEATWMPELPCGDPACAQVCFQALKSERYLYRAIDAYGCAAESWVTIEVDPSSNFFAPNIVSLSAAWPNNRFFVGGDRSVDEINYLRIFNRWGELVYARDNFAPNSPDEGWDGFYKNKSADIGVYIYDLEARRIDGSLARKQGDFTLIR